MLEIRVRPADGFEMRNHAWAGPPPALFMAVLAGELGGAYRGTRRLATVHVKYVLATILTLAGIRLMIG
jgi:hypothetical protein